MNVQILVYFLLMYADDLVLFSKIVNGLQQMLDCLFEYSQKCGMEVNIEKSKVMVFRNGGKISNADKLYYDGKLVETVENFHILDLFFVTIISSQLQKTIDK